MSQAFSFARREEGDRSAMENTCPPSTGPSLKKRFACLGIACAIVALGWLAPTPEGLSLRGEDGAGPHGRRHFPLGDRAGARRHFGSGDHGAPTGIRRPSRSSTSSDAATGATTIGVWGNFISNVIFFILASFGITRRPAENEDTHEDRVRPVAPDPRQRPRHHWGVHGGGRAALAFHFRFAPARRFSPALPSAASCAFRDAPAARPTWARPS